jgi:hypothetical protein
MMHDWKPGATILTATLAICKQCDSIRVTEGESVHYIRRVAHVRDERIALEEPECVPPPRRGTFGEW